VVVTGHVYMYLSLSLTHTGQEVVVWQPGAVCGGMAAGTARSKTHSTSHKWHLAVAVPRE
jgi:hypothetical protein